MNPHIVFETHMGTLPHDERHILDGLSPTDDERWNHRLDNALFYVIAWHGDRPVGFAFGVNPTGVAAESWDRHVPGALEFGGLIVDPEYRRQGIMIELVRLRLNMAKELGRTPVAVTRADNEKVIGYYSSRGWTPRREFLRDEVLLIPWVLETDF